ncbi:hypothetical protein EJC51_39865 [Streptomyces aquilus]|uniref:Uncharacterized protein n=1 Tax=Streptomyces aquilus TaxID=2548456 RepID=A0A3Q9C231_9ACTN|nr:hypothetical protein EJC51_39865 [Streptomyces aquilus]
MHRVQPSPPRRAPCLGADPGPGERGRPARPRARHHVRQAPDTAGQHRAAGIRLGGLRTTTRPQVLFTNLASAALGFSMFAMSPASASPSSASTPVWRCCCSPSRSAGRRPVWRRGAPGTALGDEAVALTGRAASTDRAPLGTIKQSLRESRSRRYDAISGSAWRGRPADVHRRDDRI